MTNPFQEMVRALDEAPPAVLATIASVRGSSPAPVLSRMLVSSLGEVVGTVGGGCLEGEVLREAQKVRAAGGWARVAFTLTESDEELRMVCGGTVEILLERLEPGDGTLLEAVARRADAGLSSVLARVFREGGPRPLADAPKGSAPRERAAGHEAPIRCLLGEEGEHLWGDRDRFPREALASALGVAHEERSAWIEDGSIFLEPIVGSPRLLLIGGGHVGRAIHAIAAAAGFRVTVVDDREKYVAAERFPGATRVAVPEYHDLAAHVTITPHQFVVLATRGHQFDERVLDQLLRLPRTRYLGVIGSRRKHEIAERNLVARGIPAERFRELHAPIGLDIGAVTPEEIAVAVVAEMIAVRRRREPSRAPALAAAPSSERS
jgi:xanthine dehydrogenase accessory factor